MDLIYSENKFDAVICLAGTMPARDRFEELADLPLVAADGAADSLRGAGIVPEFIVGDLDSVSKETLDAVRGTTEVIIDEDQNSTDFEKALVFVGSQLWNNILVLGMHGGEMEHSLNNWSILMRHGQNMQLTAFDADRYATPMYGSFTFSPREREIISLIPQPLARISTKGLEWDLADESLVLGAREGARNRSAGGDIHIDIHEGSLLFFCDARLPVAPKLG